MGVQIEIVALVVSPTHAYAGRPAPEEVPDPVVATRSSAQVRAGLGLVGDRYFGHQAHRDAAVTFFAVESLEALDLDQPADPTATRRNVILRGFPIDDLAAGRDRSGAQFTIDCGTGPIRFQANRPANPCAWMDPALGPGAYRGLRGRGGVRCTPLDDGLLRVGPAVLSVSES